MGARLAIAVGARDALAQPLILVADLEPEAVRARVHHDRNALVGGRRTKRLDLLDLQLGVHQARPADFGAVLEIDADSTQLDDLHQRLDRIVDGIAQAVEDVRGHRHVDGAHDLLGRLDEHLARDEFIVGIAVAERDAGAARAHRANAGLLEDASARRIPRVGDDEDLRPQVHLLEEACLGDLVHHAARSGSALGSS